METGAIAEFDFEELCRLEPELARLEADARATHDDGSRRFYCSNFVWLPMYTRLRQILGAYRRPGPGEEKVGPLYEASQFEAAYVHLSRMLPPCRACGCAVFEPVREAQLRELA